MSSLGKRGTVSSFEGREYDAFYWKIEEFSKLSEKVVHFYQSPDICVSERRHYLTFYPNGTSSKFEGFFALFFHTTSYSTCKRLHLTLGLKTKSGRIEKWFSRYILFSEDEAFGSRAMIQRSEFLKHKEELAPSDSLTFVVFLSSKAFEIIRDVENQTKTGDAEESGDKEKKGTQKVLCDIAKIWDSGDSSDAMVYVEGTEFRVHSCILAARTPVFAALFKHDTLEKETRKITINDCTPAIFKEFLNHLYTGSVQNLTTENAFGLYLAAEKYLVKDLKEVCRQCIVENLSSETFCDALQLAHKCDDKDLLESALDYFASKYRVIIRSDEWKQYLKENPTEGNDMLIKLFGPL